MPDPAARRRREPAEPPGEAARAVTAATGAGGSGSTGTGSSGANGGLTGSRRLRADRRRARRGLRLHAGRRGAVITDCGYPTITSNPLTSTVFNENDVLRAIRPSGSWPNGVVQMFYNDEHAMTLGVRQVAVKSSAGTTTTDYPVTALATDPGAPPIR